MSSSTAPAPARRTQAERRATSRTALLDAALTCLVEDGYANLTTRRVAERAGVSQGTQMHYFPTKTAFLTEAIRHVTERMAEQVTAELRLIRQERRHEAVLDHLWRMHTGPAFQAGLELMVAARTDPQLRAYLRDLDRGINRMLVAGAGELLGPVLADRPRTDGCGGDVDPVLLDLVSTSLSTIRGLAMLTPMLDSELIERRWLAARQHLLALAALHGLAPNGGQNLQQV